MVKPELGIKRSCLNCAAHFYDLNRDPMVCPKCGHSHTAESFMKMRRARPGSPEDRKSAAKRKVEMRPEAAEVDPFEADTDEEVDGDGEEVIEDTSDLGGDDDALGSDIRPESDDPNER